MKRVISKVFAGMGICCFLVPLTGLSGCSQKEVPVPNANPNSNSDEGKNTMPGSGPEKK